MTLTPDARTALWGAVLALAGLAGAAAAQPCPVAADLDAGIVFSVAGGEREVFRSLGAGRVEAVYHYGDGTQSRAVLGQGVYLLDRADILDGRILADTRMRFDFPLTPDRMPRPLAGGGWTVRVSVDDGAGTTEEIQSYSFGPHTEYTIGACSYAMIPIHLRYAPENEGLLEVLHYLPQLGVAYLARSVYGGSDERYHYHRVAPVAAGPGAGPAYGKDEP